MNWAARTSARAGSAWLISSVGWPSGTAPGQPSTNTNSPCLPDRDLFTLPVGRAYAGISPPTDDASAYPTVSRVEHALDRHLKPACAGHACTTDAWIVPVSMAADQILADSIAGGRIVFFLTAHVRNAAVPAALFRCRGAQGEIVHGTGLSAGQPLQACHFRN